MRTVVTGFAAAAAAIGGGTPAEPGIYAVRPGRPPTALSTGTGAHLAPVASPDGRRIAFMTTRSGRLQVWVTTADGANARAVTEGLVDISVVDNEAGRTSVSWSPDGRTLAFDVQGIGTPCTANCIFWEVWTLAVDTGALRRVASHARSPSFSPDGRLLLYRGDLTVYNECGNVVVSRPDGSGARRLARGEFAAWSPDGRQIAFVRACEGSVVGATTATGARTRVVWRSRLDLPFEVAWSPSGRRLGFVKSCYHRGCVETIGADGRAPRVLGFGHSPAWAPDGRIAYIDTSSPASRIVVVDGKRRTIVPAPDGLDLAPGLSWSGKRLFFAAT